MNNFNIIYFETKEHYDYDISDNDGYPDIITLGLAENRAKYLMFNKGYFAVRIVNNKNQIIKEYNKNNFNRYEYKRFKKFDSK